MKHGIKGAAMIGLLMTLPAAASAEAVVNAMSYRLLPPKAPIAVRAMDNTTENAELTRQFIEELTAHGYVVQNDAALVLSFWTDGVLGSPSGSGQGLVELRGTTSHDTPERAKVRLNVFSSQGGGLFGDKPAEGLSGASSRYTLQASIDDKTNGQRLWQGSGSDDLTGGDTLALIRQLVPPVVSAIDKTVRAKRRPQK